MQARAGSSPVFGTIYQQWRASQAHPVPADIMENSPWLEQPWLLFFHFRKLADLDPIQPQVVCTLRSVLNTETQGIHNVKSKQ